MNTSNTDDKVVLPRMIEWLVIDDANCDRFALVLGTIMLAIIIGRIVWS